MSEDKVENTEEKQSRDNSDEIGGQFVKIKVLGENQNEVYFKLKRTTRFLKLKECYSKNVGIQVAALKFLIDGVRIDDDDTPDKLNLKDEDQIEVFYSQTGGSSGSHEVGEYL